MSDKEPDLLIAYLETGFPEVIRAAASRSPILIRGESASLRSRLVRLIHDLGSEPGAPLIHFDCGARVERRLPVDGRGTRFLDRVELLDRRGQLYLKALIEKPRRWGMAPFPGTRMVFGCGDDLFERVGAGLFIPDLYYLISVLELALPRGERAATSLSAEPR
ncbi:MAG TPA: hypothetical protein PLI51_09425 [bacterium]|nr:hypothetical protein [bacterium]HPQ66934.1 hypothetical protein [bacterium]